jgi:haloalkane dehalogenase
MLAHREAGTAVNGNVLLVHGFPESSRMFAPLLEPIAQAGWRAVAPDLVGFGDSEPTGPGRAAWSAQVEALEAFRTAQGLDRVVLVVHDWGGLVGLRWACDHPEAIRALSISDTGFFSDGEWHDLAKTMRTPGAGEELVDQLNPDAVAGLLRAVSSGMTDGALADYTRVVSTPERRAAILELYRSGEFPELAPYDGRLAALGVPTLLLWGADDPFAPVAGAHRFHEEIPGSELVIVEGTGHFVYDDAHERCTEVVLSFLDRVAAQS